MSEVSLKPDAWLTRRLGKPSFHLTGNIGPGFSNRSPIADRLAEEPLFVDARIPVADAPSLKAMQRMGFSLIDTNLRFAMALSDGPSKDAPGVMFAKAEMVDTIGEIAATSFSEDRFHRDPAIPQSVANELKRCWATNFFAGERGDWMVVSCVDDRPVGFLQLIRMPSGGLLIDLVAVSARERGRGLARAMIAFACRNCGCTGQLTVGTAIANSRSISLYESMGFRLSDAQYVLHHHGAAC